MSEGWVGLFQIFEQRARGVVLAQVAAQDGIHETGLGLQSFALGNLHRFIDRGMIGDAIQPKNLIQAKAQQDLEQGFWSA
jgi:hypothetical protein